MAKKEAVHSKVAPDSSHHFNWGLIVSDFSELFVLTGRVDGDAEDSCLHPGDPVGQTRGIFEQAEALLEQKGWSLSDVIRIDICVTKDADYARNEAGIMQVWEEFFEDVDPRPAAGTLKIVDGLFRPEFLVELEFLAAR